MMHHYPWLDEYLLNKPGVEKDFKVEWQWWRYQVGGKLFAAVMCPGMEYKPEYAGKNLINLKCDPLEAELLREQYADVLPGFYSDKRCWNSVILDGELPEALLRQMCDESYRLVLEKLPKKTQRAILEGAQT